MASMVAKVLTYRVVKISKENFNILLRIDLQFISPAKKIFSARRTVKLLALNRALKIERQT